MKNIIIAVLLLAFGFTAHAAYQEVTGMRVVGRLEAPNIVKIYDEDNGAVCYLFARTVDTAAISCFKN